MKLNEFKQSFSKILKEEFGLDENDPRENIIKEFYDFCKRKLGFYNDVEVRFINDREEDMTTGSFNTVTGEIRVYLGHRALVDSLRTLAHELVHLKQIEDGKQETQSPDVPEHLKGVGTPIENEANSVAGALVKEFIKSYKSDKNLYEL